MFEPWKEGHDGGMSSMHTTSTSDACVGGMECATRHIGQRACPLLKPQESGQRHVRILQRGQPQCRATDEPKAKGHFALTRLDDIIAPYRKVRVDNAMLPGRSQSSCHPRARSSRLEWCEAWESLVTCFAPALHSRLLVRCAVLETVSSFVFMQIVLSDFLSITIPVPVALGASLLGNPLLAVRLPPSSS